MPNHTALLASTVRLVKIVPHLTSITSKTDIYLNGKWNNVRKGEQFANPDAAIEGGKTPMGIWGMGILSYIPPPWENLLKL